MNRVIMYDVYKYILSNIETLAIDLNSLLILRPSRP